MTAPKLTDEAVAELPLHAARAELLEEIMSTDAPARTTPLTPEPTRRRKAWIAPLVAAAVVAGLAVSTYVYRDGAGSDGSANVADSAKPSEHGERLLLDAPGWKLNSPGGDGDVFRKGDANLEVTRYPADSYDSYVMDREYIVDPPAPGAPIEVLGLPAQMWAYSADDHTAIREVEDGQWMEFRGQGMDQAEFLALLGQLRMVSEEAFDAALPSKFVNDDERLPVALTMIQGITEAAGSDYPFGQSFELTSDAEDPYQLGASVAGSYACAWITQFAQDQRQGDAAGAAEAARVLGTSRDWPVLNDMNAEGDYPEVVWDLADEVGTGQVPEGYRAALGCS